MTTPINKPIKDYGFYLVYEGQPSENSELDEVGCLEKSGFKSIKDCMNYIRKNDLIADFEDVILFYGIDSTGLMIVLSPFGFIFGEEFLEGN